MLDVIRRLHRSVLAALFACATLLFSSPEATAQSCFGPDGLNVPGACCVSVTPNLPPFDDQSSGATGICWTNCNVVNQVNLRVAWPTPTQTQCAQYSTTLTVFDAGGLPIMTGKLVLDYTRTWDEVDGTGALHQVWRFAAKADLSPVPGVVNACPMPTCLPPAGPHTTAFFYGYADYTCQDPALGFESVLVLYHACDRFIHRPGFSDRPGSFHPGGSYAIVSPHTAAQPFMPMNMLAPSGFLVGEASRDVPTGLVCISEDPVLQGDMTALATGCVCNLTPLTVHHTLRQFRGVTQCVGPTGTPGAWITLAINFPVNPWYHLVTSSIGRWTSPLVYPGQERAWVDEGIFVHQSACTGDWADMKYGGTTRAGWDPILPVPVFTNRFTDLADNYSAPVTGPFPTPILGSIRPTDRLIYVNYP